MSQSPWHHLSCERERSQNMVDVSLPFFATTRPLISSFWDETLPTCFIWLQIFSSWLAKFVIAFFIKQIVSWKTVLTTTQAVVACYRSYKGPCGLYFNIFFPVLKSKIRHVLPYCFKSLFCFWGTYNQIAYQLNCMLLFVASSKCVILLLPNSVLLQPFWPTKNFS